MDNKPTFPEGLDITVKNLLSFGHDGEDHAIGRLDLLLSCQGQQVCTDSQLRLAIQSLREKGFLICNKRSGDGYFMAKTMEEYDQFRSQYVSQAVTIMNIARCMDKTAEQTWDYNPDQLKMNL